MEAQEKTRGHPGKFRILVVSPHLLARESLGRLLEKESDGKVEVFAARSEEALQAVSRFHPDLIFFDLALPTRSGIETARAIKAHLPSGIVAAALLLEQEKPYQDVLQEAEIRIIVGEHRHELLPSLYALWEEETQR